MLFLIGANIICILVQFFFGDCRSFKLRKVERPNKKTANVQMPRTVEKSCGPVNPIHSVVSDAFFFSRQAPFYHVRDMPALNKF